MSASKPLIFYELVTAHGPEGHLIAANTAKTRLSLLHKGVPFECKELTIGELRALSNSKGIERLLGTFPRPSPDSFSPLTAPCSPKHRAR